MFERGDMVRVQGESRVDESDITTLRSSQHLSQRALALPNVEAPGVSQSIRAVCVVV